MVGSKILADWFDSHRLSIEKGEIVEPLSLTGDSSVRPGNGSIPVTLRPTEICRRVKLKL
jgi:hypothetical protein